MSDTDWIDVIGKDELPLNDVIGVEVNGREIALYSVAGRVYATDNICTHGQAQLCDGFLDGTQIECPMHQGRFDVRDGTAICEPATEPLQTHEVKIEGTRVYVRLADAR